MTEKIDYNAVLNPSQAEAVMTLDGPVLVIAGAGSGKTRTLVYRVAHLVETGIDPESILLLTFTRKASGEMLDRAANLTDARCRFVSGGTFHSLAHKVLRENAELVGFGNSFTILDRSDMEEGIQALAKEIQITKATVRFPKRATLASIISKAVNLEISIEDLMIDEYTQFMEYIPEITKIRELYSKYKKNNQLMDYDDLLVFFRDLLSKNESVRKELGQRYRYIMVDEYQDTNGIQAEIVKWLAFDHRNIMVVGDDSQSVYSFRGANYKNMFDFSSLFHDVKIIKLEENYRSTQPILTMTNALMNQATEKFTKCLFTKREGGGQPKVINVGTAPEQAMFIGKSIKEQMNQGIPMSEIAVLFRAAYHSFDLELELTRQDLPFVKYGGFKFMESAHIKDLVAHLRVVVNRKDSISWGRILRLIKNIGQKKSQSIINWLKDDKKNSLNLDKWPGVSKDATGLKALSELICKISAKRLPPEKAVELANEYYDPILRERFDDFPKRQKDLKQLALVAKRYNNLKNFLDELTLEPPSSSVDLENGLTGDYLTLSTVHSSKGLEWSVVYIIWAIEGYFPSSKAHLNMETLEEERRLMYVAATRAKDQLYFCYPGKEELPVWQLAEIGYKRGLSSFIQSLPPDVTEHLSPNAGGYNRLSHGSVKRYPSFINKTKNRSSKKSIETGSSSLRQGDRVNHPAFGAGVISKIQDSEKVEVLFRDIGRKLLHLKYTTLEKV